MSSKDHIFAFIVVEFILVFATLYLVTGDDPPLVYNAQQNDGPILKSSNGSDYHRVDRLAAETAVLYSLAFFLNSVSYFFYVLPIVLAFAVFAFCFNKSKGNAEGYQPI